MKSVWRTSSIWRILLVLFPNILIKHAKNEQRAADPHMINSFAAPSLTQNGLKDLSVLTNKHTTIVLKIITQNVIFGKVLNTEYYDNLKKYHITQDAGADLPYGKGRWLPGALNSLGGPELKTLMKMSKIIFMLIIILLCHKKIKLLKRHKTAHVKVSQPLPSLCSNGIFHQQHVSELTETLRGDFFLKRQDEVLLSESPLIKRQRGSKKFVATLPKVKEDKTGEKQQNQGHSKRRSQKLR